ncbi:peptidase inhibitor family I36 protein [Streptomyces diastatochromogenes]|uniref:Peptidase inhibitor family I36 protein n=1 Tax=Streptomyces diastatochromogenes TaxID=42236 RepID=A0A233SEE4_STRDA|nr:peptidase inhibitor family I36 protein [Streptomyces diastatochromogenes]MCZ0989335.1 peptidase inhibitor family I36 protein [Streptomyces diastatochromogenes]OXY94023.1 hypothetical protein BEK98_19200 [Streptomyces diastatochromogenes]
MSFIKRIAMAAGAAALLVGGTVVTAGPASAGDYCSPGYHCVFMGALGSEKHSYFNSDANFTDDRFNEICDGCTSQIVNDNVWSASNSSTGGYESHYYYDINYGGGLVFCVNPGSQVNSGQLTDDGVDGNHNGQRDEASSLLLRPSTTIHCF